MSQILSHYHSGAGRDISVIFAFLILIILLIVALFPSWVAPYGPGKRFLPYIPPDSSHILGTDDIGHDIASLLIFGTRISLVIGICAGGLSIVIGTGIGVISGYLKGRVDDLLMGLTDITLIIPKIPAIILIAAFIRPNVWILICVLGLLSWETTARVVRAKTLQVSNAGFVLSARCLGFSSYQVIFQEILPVIYPVILPKVMLVVAGAMISEASLSFLGLSDPTMESWGKMVADSFTHGGFVREMWWWFLPPACCICATIMAIIRIGMKYEQPCQETMWE
jgi:peptide/nickel transport system permease protein